MAPSGDSKKGSHTESEPSDTSTEDSLAAASSDDARDIEDAEIVSETPPGGEGAESSVDAVPESGDDRIVSDAELADPEREPEPGADGTSAVEATPEGGSDAAVPETDQVSEPETPPEPAGDAAEAAMDGVGMPGPVESAEPETGPEPEPTKTRSLFEPEPTRENVAAPPAPAATAASGGIGIVPVLIAGLVAGLIGGFAVRFIDRPEVVEGPTPAENAELIAGQAGTLTELSSRIDGVSGQLDEVAGRDIAGEISAATDAAAAPVMQELDALGQRLDAVTARIEEVSTRVEAVALRPQAPSVDPGEFDEALEAFRTEVNAAIAEATAEIEEARGEAERISEEAFAAEQAAVARAAWGDVLAALEAGEPYAEPLAAAREKLSADVPEALASAAEDGIPTLGQLQATFPDAARGALDASVRAEMGEGAMDRFTAFLRVQSGVRSLAPREGDDPDAVLSRAEAAVQAGDLKSALAEIESLPDTGKAAVEDWAARARTRLEALEAAQAVSADVNAN